MYLIQWWTKECSFPSTERYIFYVSLYKECNIHLNTVIGEI